MREISNYLVLGVAYNDYNLNVKFSRDDRRDLLFRLKKPQSFD